MRGRSDAGAAYVRQFAVAKATLPGHDVPWLAALRERAIERFAALGFPTRKLEAWKFTDLRPLTRIAFASPPRRANGISREGIARFLPEDVECHLLVFVDGRLRADLSRVGALPAGARLCGLAEALESFPDRLEAHLGREEAIDGHAPVALNTALMADGAVLMLDRGVVLDQPVHLLCLATAHEAPIAVHVRNLVVADAASGATVIESYAAAAPGAYWTNAVTDVAVREGAAIRHVKVQAEGGDAFHLAVTRVALADACRYESFVAALGGRLGRNEIAAVINGEDVECRLGGIILARGRQHLDATTLIDHAKPGSFSDEHYRGVLDEFAHGVFQGKIIVRPDAQKTNAHQLNKNLLLSETARVDTKPELEIHADDVKCGHGATAGELDADSLFYLRTRGLDGEAAERLLIESFVGEIIDSVGIPRLRPHLWRVVAGWLSRIENRADRREREARVA